MAITVTATQSGSSANRGVYLQVKVLTNATESGGASAGSNSASGVAPSGSLTPNFSNSLPVFAISADGGTGTPAAATGNTYYDATGDVTDQWWNAEGYYSGTVTASTPLTYGAGSAVGGSDHANWCAYEIPASGGTVTVDGSSPALASTETLAAITTASFSPPVGSVIVAMVVMGGTASGTGITCTMTDTGGLAWTRRAISSTSDNFQPTFIFTATVQPPPAFPVPGPSPQPPGLLAPGAFIRGPRVFPETPPSFAPAQTTAVAGAAAVAAVAMPPAEKPFLTQILGSGTGKYFADQYGQPFMIRGDSAWGLLTFAGITAGHTWQQDIDGYFSTRASQGYNFAIVATPTGPSGGMPTNGNTQDGVAPFSSPGVLNPTYWARVDYLLNSAASQGITVLLDVMFAQSVDTAGGALNGWTSGQYTSYGTALGTRYAATPNLVWFFGNDWDQDDVADYTSVINAIRAVPANQQSTVENNLESTARYNLFDSSSNTWGQTNATFNWVYTYNADYDGVEYAYGESSPLAVVRGDGNYDSGGTSTNTYQMRTLLWWGLSSGSRGYVCGDNNIDLWPSTAYAALTADVFGATIAPAAWTAFAALTGWHQLVPDSSSVLVTSGRGTKLPIISPGNTYQGGNNYVSASRTADKTLAVIYIPVPTGTTATIGIDQTQMVASYTATWIDPANGTTTSTATGSSYTTPSSANSAGNHDWVLALQGPPQTIATAGVATVSVVAPAAAAAETVTAGAAAVLAADAGATVAETATAGAATVLAAAPQPTTPETLTVTAGVATVLVLAPGATAVEMALPAAATVLAAAPAASTAETTTAGAATVLAGAPAPVAAITATAGVAVIGVTAPQATANTSGGVTANAAVAAITTVAPAPIPAGTVPAGPSAITATAPAPVPAAAALPPAAVILAGAPGATAILVSGNTAQAGVAAVAATAPAPSPALAATPAAQAAAVRTVGVPVPPSLVVARSTAAVADQDTSTPSVTDPRDGTTGVS